jgi:hypothetical protein
VQGQPFFEMGGFEYVPNGVKQQEEFSAMMQGYIVYLNPGRGTPTLKYRGTRFSNIYKKL